MYISDNEAQALHKNYVHINLELTTKKIHSMISELTRLITTPNPPFCALMRHCIQHAFSICLTQGLMSIVSCMLLVQTLSCVFATSVMLDALLSVLLQSHQILPLWVIITNKSSLFECWYSCKYVIVRPLSTVGYTSVVAIVIHSRQWSN